MSSALESEILRDVWYLALPGRELRRGQILGKMLLGQSVLLGRDASGEVFAMRDICPHRGIPLSHGRFDGREIECCYHGWRFNCAGACTHIPSLLPTQKFDLDRVLVHRFPCREVQGNVWVFMPEDGEQKGVRSEWHCRKWRLELWRFIFWSWRKLIFVHRNG